MYKSNSFSRVTMKEKQKIINPSTGEVIAEVPIASEKEVILAIEASRRAFDKGQWGKVSLSERKSFLLKISKRILDKAEELARLESLNTGKPIKETTFMDIPSSAETFQYFADNLERFLETETIEINSQISKAQSKLIRQPRGVTVLIVPWNYPLLIASWKMAQSLACGNTVILKPSSLTPLTALELGKIIQESGLPEGVVNILPARGEVVGKLLCSDKRVDMISFTGSNQVGKKIIEHSSENVKKLIMELGGKSASIVCADSDLAAAVNGSLCSIFLNQGQMCTAMSRILVEDKIYDKFLEEFVAKARRIKLGDALDCETQLGPLVSQGQRKTVADFIQKAKKEGVKIACGGKIPDNPDLAKGFFFEPTVITEAKPEMSIFQEEVFGPVVCLNKFSSLEEAVNLANNSDFALAACVWSKDESKACDLAKKIDAGTVWVNTYGMFFNQLPYGGFKQSGFGKELGKEGFLEYSCLKNILNDQTHNAKPLVNYWYGF
ncbi:MAG: aldehyde dehydrogenase family protein [Candidatus Omnitrophica bacterium]|nr:aldehyde dehydrogenase family protein [Candidatus Omnitrophota bacterium]